MENLRMLKNRNTDRYSAPNDNIKFVWWGHHCCCLTQNPQLTLLTPWILGSWYPYYCHLGTWSCPSHRWHFHSPCSFVSLACYSSLNTNADEEKVTFKYPHWKWGAVLQWWQTSFFLNAVLAQHLAHSLGQSLKGQKWSINMIFVFLFLTYLNINNY